ncbi:MAG: ferredoxin [Planctomycetes bacterium]|nr:ferredoxin [Planctomycetota bacterium]
MGITREEELNAEALKEVAKKMLIAARTAPKARGEDNLVLALMEGDEIKKVSNRMKEIAAEYDMAFFTRDAENILTAPVVFLIGTKIKPMALKKCGMCGFENCAEKEKHPKHPCAYNTGDLGIALGSAVSVATNHRVDNRIMYTIGQAVMDLNLLGDDVKFVHGIPLSATGKNPFFDREPKK